MADCRRAASFCPVVRIDSAVFECGSVPSSTPDVTTTCGKCHIRVAQMETNLRYGIVIRKSRAAIGQLCAVSTAEEVDC